MNQKEQWIDNTIDALDGLNRAFAPAHFHEAMMRRFRSLPARIVPLRSRTVWLMAAGLLLLVGLNTYTLLSSNTGGSSYATQQDVLTAEYFTPLPSIGS